MTSSTQPQPEENPTQSESATLKAATFQRLHPRVYFERFVSEGVRPDGRALAGWRGLSVNLGSISTADGSSLVRLGDTTIVCGVKAEIAEPELDDPERGFLIPNLDLPALCSPKFKPGPPGDEAQVLSERLYQTLMASGIIQLDSLCIEPGKAVWVLYVDAMCINYDGNAFDATLAAMVSALKNTKLPKATWVEDEERVVCSRKAGKEPLSVLRTPIASTFGIFDSTHTLADPTAFEEPLLDTSLTIVVDEKGNLISVSQSGGDDGAHQQGGDVLMDCISAAKSRAAQLVKDGIL